MSLQIGARLGPYEITALLGAGGMGEVYRARDSDLDRPVAIKVLPEVFAHDAERLARFEREAKTLAALNHPHIAQIYGLEKTDSARAIVMELVPGETLADRIARGPIPVEEALAIARQIAEALETAHEQGIVHRDLKPANIKVRPDGTVKVLDFGLAKLASPAETGPHVQPRGYGVQTDRGVRLQPDLTAAPTITSPAMLTGPGVILGTAAYMSPEQARGHDADRRADLWAFGCVLFEMLTGRRAFDGATVSDTLAAVLRAEPDWSALAEETPAGIRLLLRRCIEKDRGARLGAAATALFLVNERTALAAASTDPSSSQRQVDAAVAKVRQQLAGIMRRRVAAFTVGALTVAAATGAAVWMATRPDPPRVSRLTVTTSGDEALTIGGLDRDVAITPDGTRLVYHGTRQLMVRALDQLEPTGLGDVGSVRNVFVSMDGQSVGFFDGNNTLKRIAITGGPAVTVAPPDGFGARGATWSDGDTIVFATTSTTTGLLRVSAAGGTPTVLTRPDAGRGEVDHFWPEFLPGGEALLYTITSSTGNLDEAQVALLDLRTGTSKTLLRGGHHAHYVSTTGHLIFGARGSLRAVSFDLNRLEVTGSPVPILDEVVTSYEGGVQVAVAANGTLAYVPGRGGLGAQRSLVWVDRTGREEPLAAPPRAYQYLRLSPDGTRVALDIRDQDQDIWIWAFAGQTLTRITFDPAQNLFPAWTTDGRRIVFTSTRTGTANLYSQSADGTGAVIRLTESPNVHIPASVSPNGSALLVNETTPQTSSDLLLLPLAPGAGPAQPLVQTMAAEANGEISPDGRWLAYQSNETGRDEIYVRPFPDVDAGRWQISTDGGRWPLWARTGRELFFRSPGGSVMGTRVEPGLSWRASRPTQLVRAGFFQSAGTFPRQYELSPDGQRFLMIKEAGIDKGSGPQIVVVQHWDEELKQLED